MPVLIAQNQAMARIAEFLRQNRWILLGSIGIVTFTAAIEYGFGRSPLGPDGRFGWWDNNIWGSENSQRVADVYF